MHQISTFCIAMQHQFAIIHLRYACILSHDAVSEREITPYIKIDKPLVVFKFSGSNNVVFTALWSLSKTHKILA